MPSPVGHLLGGAIVGLLMPLGTSSTVRTLGAIALAGAAPDVDFLWGMHSAETHSLGAAMMAGALTLSWTRGRNPRLALAVTLAWSSHVLLDWLGSDDTPPIGVMALWPFTSAYYFADAFVFEAISRRYWLPNFWTHNLYAVCKEVVVLGPIAFLAWWRRRRVEGRR